MFFLLPFSYFYVSNIISSYSAPPTLCDGVYNIRGHIVEIKNGNRVSSLSSPSNNQHMRNNSASQGKKYTDPLNGHYGSRAKNSIYSGREYLLNHLTDLNNGNDNKISQAQTDYRSQRNEGADHVRTDKEPAGNIRKNANVYDEASSASNGARNELANTGNHGNGISKQASDSSLSSADSLEMGGGDEARNSEIKRKSSLKRRQPPGSPTKEKRKVKFNSSIEFNDGFIWLLKDNEQKPRVGTFNNNVITGARHVSEEKVVVPSTNQKSVSNNSDPSKDYSYPESVDLGLSTKPVATREDAKQVSSIKVDKEFTHERDRKQMLAAKLYDSLEEDFNEDKNVDDGAVRRDSLEFKAEKEIEDEKVSMQSTAHSTSEINNMKSVENHSLPNNPQKVIDVKDDVSIHHKGIERRRHLNELASHVESKPAVAIINNTDNGVMNSKYQNNIKDFFLKSEVNPHDNLITRDATYSHKTYEPSYSEKPFYTKDGNIGHYRSDMQDILQAMSTQSTHATDDKTHRTYGPVSNETFYHKNTAPIPAPSASNYTHRIVPQPQTDRFTEMQSKVNNTANVYNVPSSEIPYYDYKPTNDFAASDNMRPVQNSHVGMTQLHHTSHFEMPYHTEHSQHLQSNQRVHPHVHQPGNYHNTPIMESSSKTNMVPGRNHHIPGGNPQTIASTYHKPNTHINNSSKILRDQSDDLRQQMEAVRGRSHLVQDQQRILREESQLLRNQANRDGIYSLENNSTSRGVNSVQSKPEAMQNSNITQAEVFLPEKSLNTKHTSGGPVSKDTKNINAEVRLNMQNKQNGVDVDDEDDVIMRVRKSMAELQFNSNWRPGSAPNVNNEQEAVPQKTAADEMPRPSNKGKTMLGVLADDEDKIKMQSKINESPGKKSNIPIRVQSAPTSGSFHHGASAKAPQKPGIVPRPPKGPKGIFTRKNSRQDSANRRNSPMRVMYRQGNAEGEGMAAEAVPRMDVANLGMENRKMAMQGNHQSEMHLQGDVHRPGNSIENKLNKTPTDDEINELWYNVRNCLTTKPPAKASSDSIYIAPPWKQNRTWSGTTRGRSNSNRQFSLHTASSNQQGYPLRRYGSQDNLIQRENSLDNLVGNVNSRRKSALLPQRSSKGKINTNFQAFTAKTSSKYEPNRSEKPPIASRAKPNDSKCFKYLFNFITIPAKTI